MFAGWGGLQLQLYRAGEDDVVRSSGNRATGETPWQCEYCFKYYGSSNSLRNHRSVYHRHNNQVRANTASFNNITR